MAPAVQAAKKGQVGEGLPLDSVVVAAAASHARNVVQGQDEENCKRQKARAAARLENLFHSAFLLAGFDRCAQRTGAMGRFCGGAASEDGCGAVAIGRAVGRVVQRSVWRASRKLLHR